jgi:ABC-type antimicrobial peptide transport system permease subunit
VSDAVFGSARDGARPMVYTPLAQSGGIRPSARTAVSISVRSATGSPALLARSVAAALTAANRNLAFSYRPLEQDVSDALARERLLARLSGFFGGLALLLSGVGLYGLAAYSVARRRTEIGIRLALGETRAGVIRMVVSRIAALVGAGLIAGIGVSLWISKFLSALLYDLRPHDPLTLAAAAATLAVVGLWAGWLPAFRGSRIDPAEVLRRT